MIAGVVLAGGKSSRMGCDKSQLKINNKTLIQHSKIQLTEAGIKNIYLSGKNGIQDRFINKGPIAGILSCMEYLQKFDYLLFLPVDMPLINKYLILKLISQKKPTATYFENSYLPLLINNNLLNQRIIKQQLDNNQLSIGNLLDKIDAKPIKNHFPGTVFLNANTEDDWQEILTHLQ